MLTTDEFHAWCQHLQLRPEAGKIITAIRESPPVRKVRGRANNVSGRYPSSKMGVSIQFESQHVELWAIYAMECDDDVLEFYDQSSRIPLHYRAKSGRNTTQWHTPDFFVLRQDSAGRNGNQHHVSSNLKRTSLGATAMMPPERFTVLQEKLTQSSSD